jgi:hypothetical protein
MHPVTPEALLCFGHLDMLAVYFFYYNFCRAHQTLRCTPAMEAGITDRVWELSDVIEMIDLAERLAA